MPYFLSPVANDQQCNANGAPLVGGKVFTYLAGSTTPAATYVDSTTGTQQANPIILNSLGLPASPIWMNGGISLKFVIKDASDVTIRTFDNVAGINDTAQSVSEWVDSGLVPTYISATQFSVPGDQTATLQVNRRLRNRVTAGFAYGRISASVFSVGITTVTMVNDSTTLDSGLSSVAYGFLGASPLSVPYGAYQTVGDASQVLSKIQPVLATANSTGGAPANGVRVTLNPTWLDFRSATANSGAVSTLQVASALTLDIPSGATLGTTSGVASRVAIIALNNAGTVELAVCGSGVVLDESATINTTAISGTSNSASVVYSVSARTGVSFRLVGYFQSTQATAGTWATQPSLVQGIGSGIAGQVPTVSMVRLHSPFASTAGYGTTNTKIRRFSTVVTNQGIDIAYVDSVTLGATFTINVSGDYSISYTDQYTGADIATITLNDSVPTVAPLVAEVLAGAQSLGANNPTEASWTGYLAAGSVIRARTFSGLGSGTTTAYGQFTIARVS